MASTTRTTAILKRLSNFAAGVAGPFTDSRRWEFITNMLTGLVAGWHVHLTAVAGATQRGQVNIHAAPRRNSADTSPMNTGTHRPLLRACSDGRPRW